VDAVSDRRKLRQGNGGKLTRDRAQWTHKTRLGAGSAAVRPAASRTWAAGRDQLAGISVRHGSGGVQAVQGGQAIRCDPALLRPSGASRNDRQHDPAPRVPGRSQPWSRTETRTPADGAAL
jgi:hypothetical protein